MCHVKILENVLTSNNEIDLCVEIKISSLFKFLLVHSANSYPLALFIITFFLKFSFIEPGNIVITKYKQINDIRNDCIKTIFEKKLYIFEFFEKIKLIKKINQIYPSYRNLFKLLPKIITDKIKIIIVNNGNLNLRIFLLSIKNRIMNKGPKNEEKSTKLFKKTTFNKLIDPPLNKFYKLP